MTPHTLAHALDELTENRPYPGLTTKERQFLYTGRLKMEDTTIDPETCDIQYCCMEQFIGKIDCRTGEGLVCPVCSKRWSLDGLVWRVVE